MSNEPTIQDVNTYWDENPVHSVEFSDSSDFDAYIKQIDTIRWNENERWAKNDFYEFPTGHGKRLLDAGCGIGVFARFYARKGFNLHAIDLSYKSLTIAQRSLKMLDLNATVIRASVEDIPYPNDFFDYIVSNGVIHHTPNTLKAVDEFYRVLKPGGIASVCIYYQNFWLRYPQWYLVKVMIPFLLKKSTGRELMLSPKNPEDLVRAYDGNNTPIANLYSRKQADKLFEKFESLRVALHYFPARFIKFVKMGGVFHKFMDHKFGTLIYYLLKKPE